MKLTSANIAVVEGDTHLSKWIENAGRLDVAGEFLSKFKPHIPLGGVVVDVGACLGDHTATYSAWVGAAGKIHAFEPNPLAFECLEYNMRASANVTIYSCALGAERKAGFSVIQNPNLGMARLADDGKGTVKTVTLDSLAAEWTRLDFLKIDVEGYEVFVLDGAMETIKRFRPAMLIEVHQRLLSELGFTKDDIYRRLDALGYSYAATRLNETLDSPEIDIICLPNATAKVVSLVPSKPAALPQSGTRVHLLALPNVQTTRAYSLDGFCSMTINFARILKDLGYTVILYASEENEAPCDELVTVITKEEQQTFLDATFPDPTPYQYAYIEHWSPIWQLANARMIKEIARRKQPRDFLCLIGGWSQHPVVQAHSGMMAVEYSIGYNGSFTPYRVFESRAWQHVTYGFQGIVDARFFDTVIPCFYDQNEFPFREKKEDFALFVGRLVPRKGIGIACEAAAKAGIPLKVIGHGDASLVTHGAEYLGAINAAERNEWMSRARCVMTPTIYVEPFNQVAVEAQLCGTPVISTNVGGFTETVEQGRTGYRCDYLGEFVQALHDVRELDPTYIRRRAVETYSMDAVKHDYQRYFERLMLLWKDGWNSCDEVSDTQACLRAVG